MSDMIRSCKRWRPLLTQYIDEAVDDRQRTEVERHLTDCADCRSFVEGCRSVRGLLKSATPSTLPESFDRNLAQRLVQIDVETARRAATPWGALGALFARPVLRPALALGVAAIAVGVFAHHGPTATRAVHPRAEDEALVVQCVAQHRSDAETQPLSDWSAQNLASRLDAQQTDVAPAASSDTDSL